MKLSFVAFVLLLNHSVFAGLNSMNRREFLSSCAMGVTGLARFAGDLIGASGGDHLNSLISLRTGQLKAAGYFGPEEIRRRFSIFMESPQSGTNAVVLVGSIGSGKSFLVDRASLVWGARANDEAESDRFITLNDLPNSLVLKENEPVSPDQRAAVLKSLATPIVSKLRDFVRGLENSNDESKIIIFIDHLQRIPQLVRQDLMTVVQSELRGLPSPVRSRVRLVYAFTSFSAADLGVTFPNLSQINLDSF